MKGVSSDLITEMRYIELWLFLQYPFPMYN